MGYRVQEIRKNKKMTQKELAEKSGVSRTIISAIESGKPVTTTTKTLMKIAVALDTTIDAIFFAESV